jgi:hypothetical protein
MNFENVFLGPRSIQVCHLRSKTPLTSVDCLRGPPHRIQHGHKSPHVPRCPAELLAAMPASFPAPLRRTLAPPPLLSPHATCGVHRSDAGPPGRRLVSRVPPLLLVHAAPLLQARAALAPPRRDPAIAPRPPHAPPGSRR